MAAQRDRARAARAAERRAEQGAESIPQVAAGRAGVLPARPGCLGLELGLGLVAASGLGLGLGLG